eukprot:CCRYP_008465-RA/>CCRYP_008465-RA protein AED:0.38 eAED:0.38 QI:36/1/1/1/1/0.5/2/212/207
MPFPNYLQTLNLRLFPKAAKTGIKSSNIFDQSMSSNTTQGTEQRQRTSNLRLYPFPKAAKDIRDSATVRYIHDNAAKECDFPEFVQADIVDICTDTEFASRSWVFNRAVLSNCIDGGYFVEMKHAVTSAQECAQSCVEDHDGDDVGTYDVLGFRYGCDAKCACLVDSNEVSSSKWDGSATSECYLFAYPLALAVVDKDGLDDDTWSC